MKRKILLLLMTITMTSLFSCKKRTGVRTPAPASNDFYEINSEGLIAHHNGIRCKVKGEGVEDFFKENEFMFMRLSENGKYAFLKINDLDEFVKAEVPEGEKALEIVFFEPQVDNSNDQRAKVFSSDPVTQDGVTTTIIGEVRVNTATLLGAVYSLEVKAKKGEAPAVTEALQEGAKVEECENHSFSQTIISR